MPELMAWLSGVAALIVIMSALGAAVAVYRSALTSTSLREARATIEDLRGEVTDYQRREERLENDHLRLKDHMEAEIMLAEQQQQACRDRVTVLEDLLTKRADDAEIRAEIAAVRKVVDENVMAQLTAILTAMEAQNT